MLNMNKGSPGCLHEEITTRGSACRDPHFCKLPYPYALCRSEACPGLGASFCSPLLQGPSLEIRRQRGHGLNFFDHGSYMGAGPCKCPRSPEACCPGQHACDEFGLHLPWSNGGGRNLPRIRKRPMKSPWVRCQG